MLSLDSAVGDFEQADVLVEGKKITAVKPNISAPNAQVIDACKCVVMPGFVDTHRHMWQGFLRNIAAGRLAGRLHQSDPEEVRRELSCRRMSMSPTC